VLIVLGLVAGFALVVAWVWAARWLDESRRTRFFFEDRDTYLLLKLEQQVGSGQRDLVAMLALREALRLKLTGVGYERLLVHLTALKIANSRAFWFLIGALGPAFGNDGVKVAVVCARRTQAEARFRESGLLMPFASIREAEGYLWSNDPPRGVLLDKGQLDALLTPKGAGPPRVRRAA
jgi:hypothetical protein